MKLMYDVCKDLDVEVSDVLNGRRKADVVAAREMIVKLLKRSYSFKAISYLTSLKYTTVKNNFYRINEKLETRGFKKEKDIYERLKEKYN